MRTSPNLSPAHELVRFTNDLARKPDGQSFARYLKSSGTLYAIFGEGPCSDFGQLAVTGEIFLGISLLERPRRRNGVVDPDTFAGVKFERSLPWLLSCGIVKPELGEGYLAYMSRHNKWKIARPIAEIVHYFEDNHPGRPRDVWSEYRDRIMRGLEKQSPHAHIPLLP